jgi:hypothetical protein
MAASWLPATEAALVLDVTRQNVWKMVQRGALTGRQTLRGRNSRALEIAFDSLPLEAQARYLAKHPEAAIVPAGERTLAIVTPELRRASWDRASEPQRERALLRRSAILAFAEFRRQWAGREGITAARAKWIADFRQANPSIEKLSYSSLCRWAERFEKLGLEGLLDGNDGHGRRGLSVIPKAARNFFHARLLDGDSPTIARAIADTRLAGEESGWNLPTADDAFYRYAKRIPAVLKRARRDDIDKPENYSAFVPRDYSTFEAMRLIQSDHHKADVWVSCEGMVCGRGGCRAGHRPWWTPFFDIASRRVLGWECYLDEPNSDRILSAFRKTVIEFGLPIGVYIDNGKDYKKAFGKELRDQRRSPLPEDFFRNILVPLGVTPHYATPYNAKAKAIERMFGSFVSRVWRGTEAYVGRLGRRTEKAHHLYQNPEKLPTFSSFLEQLEAEIAIYNETPHRGQGMKGQSPAEVFAARRIPRREPDAHAFRLAFWATHERVVGRNGVSVNGYTYMLLTREAQFQYQDSRVLVLVNPLNATEAAILNEKKQLISLARMQGFATNDADDPVTQEHIRLTQRLNRDMRERMRNTIDPEAARHVRRFKAQDKTVLLKKVAQRLRERDRERLALAAGETVIQALPHYSRLARDVEEHRALLSNPSGLTPEELELANSVEDRFETTGQFLSAPDPWLYTPREVPPPSEEEEQRYARESARLRAKRELERKEREGLCGVEGCEGKEVGRDFAEIRICADHYVLLLDGPEWTDEAKEKLRKDLLCQS